MTARDVIDEHRRAGRRFEAAGVTSFAREAGPAGDGTPVVCIAPAELDAYVDLLRGADGGRAFLRIMRGFERTPGKRALYTGVVGSGAA